MAWDKTKNTPEQLRAYYKKYYEEKRKAKLKKEREEHPVYRICTMCGEKFKARGQQKYCCEACAKLAAKIRSKILSQDGRYNKIYEKYRNSEKGKETIQKYLHSEKGQEARRKYFQSEKAKETRRKYAQSERGKEVYRRYYEKRKANGGLPLSQKPENKENPLAE